mgnify:CR=1 FL=1
MPILQGDDRRDEARGNERHLDRPIERVEADPLYRQFLEASQSANVPGQTSVPDAVCCAMRRAVALLRPAAIVCATHSGATSLRVARERAEAPILSLTPQRAAARRLVLAWGVHSLHVSEVTEFNEVRMLAGDLVRREGFGQPGDPYVAIAGVPFGQSGTTNLMHIGIV